MSELPLVGVLEKMFPLMLRYFKIYEAFFKTHGNASILVGLSGGLYEPRRNQKPKETNTESEHYLTT